LHTSGGPPTHAPPWHASLVVQRLPSLHGFALLVNTHPLAGLHESLVQPFPSLHTSGGPPTQEPPAHASFVVQALPSLHGVTLLVITHPVAGLHASSLRPFASLHASGGPPTQVPPGHASFVVQALPSLHGAALLVKTHPLAGLQESSVQPFPSL